MDIYTPEYECSDLGLLISSIDQHISNYADRAPPKPTKTDFTEFSSGFPDILYGLVSQLSRKPVSQHRYLWVRTLEAVVDYAVTISCLYRDVQYHARHPTDVPSTSTELKKAFSNLYSYVKSFLSQADEQLLLNCGNVYDDNVRSSFAGLLSKSFELAETGKEIKYDGGFFDAVVTLAVDSVAYVELAKYEQWEHKLMAQADLMQVLVGLTKTSFRLGKPRQIKPLFVGDSGRPLITERYPFNLTSHLDTDFTLLMDFYRYAGFCLVTLAVADTAANDIKSEYAHLADYYLTTLLTLPNLSLTNYSITFELLSSAYLSGAAPALKPDQYILSQEREEISFFYVLNYLLRLENLTGLVEPNPRIKAEISYFVKAFGKRISSDLDILASRNQSYSNSTISMLSLEQRATAAAPSPNAKTLSTILFEGSYKEKLHLVKSFFESLAAAIDTPEAATLASLLEKFNFESVPGGVSVTRSMRNQDFHHLLGNIDIAVFPGKKLYVEAVEKIARLLQLLTITHLKGTLGLDFRPDELLSYLYKTTYRFENVSLIKKLVQIDDKSRLSRANRAPISVVQEVNSQYDMLTATRELEQILQ